jgi:hypothetical protein
VVSGEELPQGIEVDLAVGVGGAKRPFELVLDLGALDHADLRDEPVEAQADRRVADPVRLGSLLERAAREDEALQERQVLGVEVVEPAEIRRR